MRGTSPLSSLLREIEASGSTLTLCLPGREPLRIGRHPELAVVRLRSGAACRALERRDHLALAEAFLRGDVEVEGDLLEAVRVASHLDLEVSLTERLRFAWRLLAPGRDGRQRRAVSAHYDRPAGFFLPWLCRWRSYTHGFYEREGECLSDAQERKLAFAFEALGLEAGMRVLDVGVGWGSFLEFAGLRGVRVHGLTISREQYRFVSDLIARRRLSCTVELADFHAVPGAGRYDAAVLMGSLEHLPDYPRVAGLLAEHLGPVGRVYADFCAQRTSFLFGRFMRKYIWPGVTSYVNVPRLVDALLRRGFSVHGLEEDTRSYGYTCRAWADRLERAAPELAERFDAPSVRAFRLYLRASEHFFLTDRSQAYHLVAGRGPREPGSRRPAAPVV